MIDVITPDATAAAATMIGQFWQWLVAIVVGLPTIGAIVSNRLTRLRADRSERVDIAARDATVQGLVEENKRLQTHNTALVGYFEEAQLQIIELQKKVGEMSRQIGELLKEHGAD